MNVGRCERSDLPRRSAFEREREDARLTTMVGALIADAQHLAIKGQDVIVVVANGEARVHKSLFASSQIESRQTAPTLGTTADVVDESRAVAGPTWRFERL